jgi:hypothetical protein
MSGTGRKRRSTKFDFFLDTPSSQKLPFQSLVRRLNATEEIFLGFTQDGAHMVSYTISPPSHPKEVCPLLFNFHRFTSDLFAKDPKVCLRWRHCISLAHHVAERADTTGQFGTNFGAGPTGGGVGMDPTDALEVETSNNLVNTPVQILESGVIICTVATKNDDDMRREMTGAWNQGPVYNEEVAYFSICLSPSAMEATQSRSSAASTTTVNMNICWFSLVVSSFPVGASPLCPEPAQVVLTSPSHANRQSSLSGAVQTISAYNRDYILAAKNQNGLHIFRLAVETVQQHSSPSLPSSPPSSLPPQKKMGKQSSISSPPVFGTGTGAHKITVTFAGNKRWFYASEPASEIHHLCQVEGEQLRCTSFHDGSQLHENGAFFVKVQEPQMVFDLEAWLTLNLKKIVPKSLKVAKLLDHEHKLMPFVDGEWTSISSVALISCHGAKDPYIIGLALGLDTLTGQTSILRAFTRKGNSKAPGPNHMRRMCHDFASRMFSQFAPPSFNENKGGQQAPRRACHYQSPQTHVLSNRNVLKGVSMKVLENPKFPQEISM